MATREVKVYICDWCKDETSIDVKRGYTGQQIGWEDDWVEDSPPKGWMSIPVIIAVGKTQHDFLCVDCNEDMCNKIYLAREEVKTKRTK